MGCTVSTCNYTEPMMLNTDIMDKLDIDVLKKSSDNSIPHYKRNNILTIDTSWVV
tara:strand:+ start:660 stop:824 length:165 start_codon:yes stop_codon:yes gene_type:complete